MPGMQTGKLKWETIARFGDWRVQRTKSGALYQVVGKGEKHGNTFFSRQSAIKEAKRRAKTKAGRK